MKTIINKINSFLERLTHNGLGHGKFVVTNAIEVDNTKCIFYSNCNNIKRFNNVIIRFNMNIRFHLNGDTK